MRLAIICSHFNPGGFHAQRRNLLRFRRQMGVQGVPVFIAELAYDGEFFLSEDEYTFHYRGDRNNVLWHKENLLNLAAERVPPEYDVIAWIDPDVLFLSKDWIVDTARALESLAIVQLFTEAWWTDEDGRCYKRMRGAVADGILRVGYNHPGFAWAARRDLWSKGGGLCELAILGGGDTLLASACLDTEIPVEMNYPHWRTWTRPSSAWIASHGGCGYIDGVLVHEWHGNESGRAYMERHALHEGIDISSSVSRRADGILEFMTHVDLALRGAFYNYFISRQEDD